MSIIIMILLLCFLILVHEFGHFVAARALGIKVDKFAIGFPFGPTLWSKKIGDVEYLVHACLLGGYVAFPDDDKDSTLPLDSPERFANNPVWKRMIVISAGVITNLITAFALVFLVAGIWGQLPSGVQQVYINKIDAQKGASVLNSGLQAGDKIVSINGSNISSTYALTLFAKNSAANDAKVDKKFVEQNLEKLRSLNSNLDPKQTISSGISVKLPQNSGIELGIKMDDDTLLGITEYKPAEIILNDEQIKLRDSIDKKSQYIVSDGTLTLENLAYAISDGVKPLNITIERNGQIIELKPVYPDKDGIIGVMLDPRPVLVKTKTPAQIIKAGSKYLWDQTALQLYAFKQLLTGKIPAKNIHGIVAVAKVGGDVIQTGGMSSGLLLAAIISAWLAILNFLPIPALDGGHFMFLIIEMLRGGKPVSQKAIDIMGNICFFALLGLGLLIILNDIIALIKHQL